MVRRFSISEAISYGWHQTRKNLKFFIILIIIVGATYIAPGIVSSLFGEDENSFLGFIVTLVGWIIQVAVGLGVVGIALSVHDKKHAKYEHLFKHFNLIIPYIAATIVYFLIVVTGFILFVVPGIVWSIKFGYYTYFMVDRKMGPIDALKASSKLTHGVKWNIFRFRVVLTIINILGAIPFFLGLLITVPLTFMAEAYVYRKLASK